MVVIVILALTITVNVDAVLAASSTGTSNAKISQITSAASNVNSYYKTNKKLPSYVTVNNKKITMPQFLYLLAAGTSNIYSGSKSSITIKTVKLPTSSTEKLSKGNIKKTEYVTISKNLKKYVDTNGKIPNYLSTSRGKMRMESAVYMFSRVMVFYKSNKRLPNYVAVSSWTGKSYSLDEGGDVSPIEITVTQAQLNEASSNLKTFIENHNKMPTTVAIAGKKVTIAQFLNLLAQSLINISTGQSNTLQTLKIYSSSIPTETISAGNIGKDDYLNLAGIISGLKSNSSLPDSLTTSLGNMRSESTIYLFLKVLYFYNTNNRLPNYVTVTPWTGTTVSGTGEGIRRPVYIISDMISNTTTDNARINAVITALKKLGLQAYNYGVGTDNIGILSNSSIPINALIVEICGGACAGTIYEMGTSYYKSLKATRKVFMVFTDGATRITGLDWLPRAHDDNFSPSTFTGLAHPDQYLSDNGYGYYEGYNNSKLTELVNRLYTEATT